MYLANHHEGFFNYYFNVSVEICSSILHSLASTYVYFQFCLLKLYLANFTILEVYNVEFVFSV